MEQPANTPDGRTCGPCTACCTHLPIPAGQVSAVEKPAGVVCQHVCEHGCAIYPDRPQMCVEFCCAWLTDASWPDSWRPRESGLLCLRESLDGVGFAGLIYEIVAGALQTPTAEKIIARLLAACEMVVLVAESGRRETLISRRALERGNVAAAPHFTGLVLPVRETPIDTG